MGSTSDDVPYMEFDQFALKVYTTTEIQKLAEVEIYNPETFDLLGHPLPHGLHDSKLGPVDYHERCETCGQIGRYCPGHYGYIHLDVPVFHPMLFPFMYNLLKGSCIFCHRFMCNTSSGRTKVLLAQLRCIELGCYSLAESLFYQIRDRVETAESKAENAAILEVMSADIEALDEKLAKLNGKTIEELLHEKTLPTKNAVDLKNTLMKDYLKTQLYYHRTVCPLCKGRNGALRNDENRSIIIDFGGKGIGKMKLPKKLAEKLDEGEIEDYLEEAAQISDWEDENGVTVAGGKKSALKEQLKAVAENKCDKFTWRGSEVREHFRSLWKNEGTFLKKIFHLFNVETKGCPMDVLFFELLLVPPTKYRPMRIFKGDKFEDVQTTAFKRVIECNEAMYCLKRATDKNVDNKFVEKYEAKYEKKLRGSNIEEKLHSAYIDLQMKINQLYDSEPQPNDLKAPTGVRQLLEKKQGLFRMHMMGKRVNYACRSVITPDPYLDVDEIGIPEIFAKMLTFPDVVSGLNIGKMRQAILKGPNVYPGANFTSNTGRDTDKRFLPECQKMRQQDSRLLKTVGGRLSQDVTVYRHLLNNEMLLMNRQPSLHKPSIMGHRARILKGQKALRMNYAPCKAYNADFDGDEMNGHFIQNVIGQVEARELANVGSSYLVPKDGTPILGLIQDHVVSGVLLTLRDTFLNKKDFTHLILAAFGNYLKRIVLPPPTILKPEILWTGKQVITAIVKNCVPNGAQMINLNGKAKTGLSCWKVGNLPPPTFEMSESEVIFSRGALVNGVLDKAHYGATQYGLIHCCYELYGHKCATSILSCFSRCFTTYLQFHGFSLGVADILVNDDANKERRKIIRKLRREGDNVVKKAFNLPEDATKLQVKHVCAKAYNNNRKNKNDVKMLDFTMKQFMSKHGTNINNACVPNGLIRSFPQNSLQLMIQSGAKGSSVNAIQISAALGQIELEGQRPGLSATGRTLPSFKTFDTSPRAGGFIDERFLTGINPQELFFHTMAGREGLIDTAVKTSRSGYLQRCIIKHLEGIKVCYDGTVRDHDGSVVQFKYGEDGLDVGKASFLTPKQFSFLGKNVEAVRNSVITKEIREEQFDFAAAQKSFAKIKRRTKKRANIKRLFNSGFTEFSKEYPGMDKNVIVNQWHSLTKEEKQDWHDTSESIIPDPVDVQYNVYRTLGALPEKLLMEIDAYMKNMEFENEGFKKSLYWKGLKSFVEPGECVGLLAAQSIGEPSTQMTLNTFHFAGRGEMNVTLGIPRLREILMTSGAHIATPSAEALIKDTATEADVEKLKQKFNRIYLKQCIKSVRIEERKEVVNTGSRKIYVIGLEISKSKQREINARHILRSRVIKRLEQGFIVLVCSQIRKMMTEISNYDAVVHRKLIVANESLNEDDIVGKKRRNDDESSDDDDAEQQDIDASEARLRQRHLDDAAEYEGEENEETELIATNAKSIEKDFMELNDDEDSEKEENEDAEMNRNTADLDDSFDQRKNLPHNEHKLDVNLIVENVVEHFVVHETQKIEKCVIREEMKNGKDMKILQTQGINLEAFYECSNVLDVNTIYSNDLNLMLSKYGIEACNRAIVKEMNNVFGVYGIDVSSRHLTLVADYMTFTGKIAPFSRAAMASSSSPLQKMTFETTMAFMRETLQNGDDDFLNSPSARFVTGQLMKGGTGVFDVMLEPHYVFKDESSKEEEQNDILRVVFD